MKTRTILLAAAVASTLAAVTVYGRLRAKRRGSRLTAGEAEGLLRTLDTAFESTMQAFDVSAGQEGDLDERDAQANEAAQRFMETVETLRPQLGGLQPSCDALATMFGDARLQLMAFAINRKNRGTPDSAQAEAEAADRTTFSRGAGPLYRELAGALR